MSTRSPQAGDTVGHYRLDGVIGLGGMGVVHAATDLRLGRRAALKIVLAHHASSPPYVARFRHEATVLARLDSPHVVAIYDHGEHEGQPYIAMQYAGGGDLGALLRTRGAMPPTIAARVAAQVADALVSAHAVGVVHRDVKPANVLLRDDRLDRLHVYLSDFGVALTESTGLTSPGAVAGTWNYLAPERINGAPGSPASDIYAVGCLFHELLTGRPPYPGSDVEVAMEHLTSPVPQLPGTDPTALGVNRVLARAMAKDPGQRQPTAAALRDELRELAGGTVTGSFVGGTSVPGGPPHLGGFSGQQGAHHGPVGSGRRPGRRRAAVAGAAVGVLAVVGSGVGLALVVADDGSDDTPTAGPGTSGATSDPTSATTSPTPTPEPSPGSERAVVNDLDGDGRGEAVLGGYEGTYVLRAGPAGFADVDRRPVEDAELVGDVDGDGTADLVAIEGEAPSLVVTSYAGGRRALPTSVVDTPPPDDQLDQDFLLADVDGDGVDDLVVATARGRRATELTVALSLGDGSFAASERWYSGPLDPRQSGWAVADLDADGDDDLVHTATVDKGYVVKRAEVVVSSGSATEGFTVPYGPLRVPEEMDGSFFSLDRIDAADVDGDGAPEVVGLSPYGFTAVVWEWLGDRFDSGRLWTDPDAPFDAPGGGGIQGTLADVDGDGMADAITNGLEGVRVHLSTGTSFRHAPAWAERGTPEATSLLDRVSLGIY